MSGCVLVVDDEATIRAALARFFTKQGWQVHQADDGATALAHLVGDGAPEVDLVVCDLRMPGVSGMDVYARTVAARPDLGRRFIFSSGDIVSAEVHDFLERAPCPVLQKPFELAKLRAAIERVQAPA